MEWVIPDLKEKPILPLYPWALAAVGAATGPDCPEQRTGSCQTLASSTKAPLAPPEPHAHGICHGKAGRNTGEMGLTLTRVPAPLSPPWCQPERQNWSCQAELGFFRDTVSLNLTVIIASKWHNSCPIVAENPNQQLQDHAVSNTYERDDDALLPSVKWVFFWWYIWKTCLNLLSFCAPCTISFPILHTDITLWLHWNSLWSTKSLCETQQIFIWTLLGSLQRPSPSLFFYQQLQPPQEHSASQTISLYPCQADKRRTREEKSALKPLKDGSHEVSESGEGLIKRKGNAIWGTEWLWEKEKWKN